MHWLHDACFYEIYPQSFFDTNDDGIGDIKGIEDKLSYIKDLGCNAIWMNPCFDSPFADAGYDVRDYKKVAPRYGTNEDLIHLFAKAHEMGIHILLDLVPGHTSEEHPWFVESKKAERNEYSNRYIWTNSWYHSPENLRGVAGRAERDGVYVINFFASQPALNYGFLNPSEEYQKGIDAPETVKTCEAIYDVMKFWLALGCDGFRVDMADSLVKLDDEKKSGTVKVWQRIIGWMRKEFPEAVLVSEWNNPERALEAGFDMDFMLDWTGNGYNLLMRDTVTNKHNPVFKKNSQRSICDFLKDYGPKYEKIKNKGKYCLITGNHDTPRVSYYLDESECKIAYAFLLTMPGAPFLYYGDEIHMRYQEELPTKEGGYTRTGSRTPMQWDDKENAGFSKANKEKLYLPVDAREGANNVASQMGREDSLWHVTKELLALRKSKKDLLEDNNLEFVLAKEDSRAFAFKRGELMIVVNPDEKEQRISLNESLGEKLFLLGEIKESDGTLLMGGQSFAVYPILNRR